jgi:2-alkenal reductase
MRKLNWLVGLVLVTLLIFTLTPIVHPQDSGAAVAIAQSGVFTDVYNHVSPSVVAINVVAQSQNPNLQRQGGEIMGSGSGFVIDTNGDIVTNNHVVDGATSIEVNFFDGTLARAEVVGVDPDSDIAVIKVDVPAEKLSPITWGDSDSLSIGQPVLAIGSPFGQRWTLTSGIVSALDRTIHGLTNFSIGGVIQTDASINPGNSGGPLLDLDGRVIGVNSQIASASGSSAGIGFAIPGNLTRKVSQILIENGSVSYSYLGIGGGDVTLSLIEAFKLPNDTQGVVIEEVTPGSPAALAGLHSPTGLATATPLQAPTTVDIITAINGQPLHGIGSLISYLAKQTKPGDEVTLSVLRDGANQLDLPVHLVARPQ